jgi:hypothetical protein
MEREHVTSVLQSVHIFQNPKRFRIPVRLCNCDLHREDLISVRVDPIKSESPNQALSSFSKIKIKKIKKNRMSHFVLISFENEGRILFPEPEIFTLKHKYTNTHI